MKPSAPTPAVPISPAFSPPPSELVAFVLRSPGALPPKEAAWLRALSARVAVHFQLDSPQWDDENFRGFVPCVREIPNARVEIGPRGAITDEGLKSLLDVSHLKGLTLSWQKVSDEGVRRLQKLSRLEYLVLSAIPVTDKTVELFVSSGKYKGLEVNRTAATVACLPAILTNTDLHRLSLLHFQLTDDDLRRLTSLKKLTSLRIGGSVLSNDGMKHLEALPRTLSVRNCIRQNR